MKFAKYEGLGNDFIIVDADRVGALTPHDVRALCDRRFGVGADGVLLLGAGEATRWRMVVLNADGSRPEMCGNGLRCVARAIADREPDHPTTFPVETDAGLLHVELDEAQVGVDMGPAVDGGSVAVSVGSRTVEGRRIETGNPHLILFGAWSQTEIAELGPALSTHARFPAGVNVSFADVRSPEHVKLTVWERGAGLTLACGTGACATVAAGWLEGRLTAGRSVRVELPGGALSISGEPAAIHMRGPARRVFEGQWIGRPMRART